MVNAMIPSPARRRALGGGTQGRLSPGWRPPSGGVTDRRFDVPTYFLHDMPQAVLRTGPSHQRDQAEPVVEEPCSFERWPDIPIQVIAAADDRFFPLEFQQRVARERLEKETHVMPGGHLVALARPDELARQLLRLEREVP